MPVLDCWQISFRPERPDPNQILTVAKRAINGHRPYCKPTDSPRGLRDLLMERSGFAYFHAIEGRLRVKVAHVKGSPSRARELENALRSLVAVQHVQANPATGNVLVLYDPRQIGQEEVLTAVKPWHAMPQPTAESPRGVCCRCGQPVAVSSDVRHPSKGLWSVLLRLLESLGFFLLETGVQRLVLAAI